MKLQLLIFLVPIVILATIRAFAHHRFVLRVARETVEFAFGVGAVLFLDGVAIPPDHATVAQVMGEFVATERALVRVLLFGEHTLGFFPATFAQADPHGPGDGDLTDLRVLLDTDDLAADGVTAFGGRVAAVGTGHLVSPIVKLLQ